jgi:NAD-dependent aldehyde dehydrogenases
MQSVLEKLGIAGENPGVFCGEWRGGGGKIDKISPIDGRKLATVQTASGDDYDTAIARAQEAFLKWRTTPGPVRGETVRRLGNGLREMKHDARPTGDDSKTGKNYTPRAKVKCRK